MPAASTSSAVTDTHAALLAEIEPTIDAAPDPHILLSNTCAAVARLLKRDSDKAHREKMLDAIARFFHVSCPGATCPPEKIDQLKQFAKKAVRLVLAERGNIRKTVPLVDGNHPLRRGTDLSLTDEVSAADVEQPTTIIEVPPPPPLACATFAELFPAALTWKLRRILTFFHRRNPDIKRELPVPFLLSPEFDARFEAAIRTRIAPAMIKSGRSIPMFETSRAWADATTADFWTFLAEDSRRKEAVFTAWEFAWSALRQQRTTKEDKATGQFRAVLVASPALKELRELLDPATPGAYEIPPLRNPELELLAALLFEFDRAQLETAWIKLRQIYEQEMDRRWYQDKARQGALRDSLLDVFGTLPDRTGEFVAILCYYNFPHMNLHFLERFTHNKGRNDAERTAKIPYLMRFLAQPGVAELRQKELDAERERQEQLKAQRAAAS